MNGANWCQLVQNTIPHHPDKWCQLVLLPLGKHQSAPTAKNLQIISAAVMSLLTRARARDRERLLP
jgi:hypothetical protein